MPRHSAAPSARTSRSPGTRTVGTRRRCRSSSLGPSSPTTSGFSRSRRYRRTRKGWPRSQGPRPFRSQPASACSRSGPSGRCSSSGARRSCNRTSLIAAACSRHNPLGPINTIVSAQVAMASPNFVALEICLYPPDWTRELLTEPLEYTDGFLVLADRPGWGVELDVELCRGHPYQPYKLPILEHPGGAIADW
ncbi:MAG: hypothetical protein E6G10_00400 [Actinobacteria bacterium]|nr:MAG: hypothetical protein E6G10_00400 [Actinomycetota bacterium]